MIKLSHRLLPTAELNRPGVQLPVKSGNLCDILMHFRAKNVKKEHKTPLNINHKSRECE
jgi:hypothetical protein